MIVVLVTAKDKQEARKLSQALVKKHLAACVNIVDKIESFFWWQGKVDKSNEALLIIKTKKSLFERLRKEVKRIHSYEVPEIIALPIIEADQDYRKWVQDVTE
jgi:periplasmic divalent cation tolerance protein